MHNGSKLEDKRIDTETNLLLTLDFLVTETHSERVEIYYDSDPTKVIEDFSKKWSKL